MCQHDLHRVPGKLEPQTVPRAGTEREESIRVSLGHLFRHEVVRVEPVSIGAPDRGIAVHLEERYEHFGALR